MATDRDDTAGPAAALTDAPTAALVVGEGGRWPLPWQRDWARRAVASRGHALALHGAPGEGALQAALGLAQSWLCEASRDGLACGGCTSCHAIAGRLHADLLLLMPEELRRRIGWPLIGDKPEGSRDDAEGAKAARKPSKQLRVEELRQAIDWTATTSARGRGKVLVIHPALAMNPIGANAVLKTLEEPPAGVRILLTAADPQRLMPTIRSRCQVMRLPLPSREAAVAWLKGEGVADAELLLDAAGNRPIDALDWSREGIDGARWLALPAAIAQGRAEALAPWPLPQAVEVLLRLCHDAMLAAAGAGRNGQPPLVAGAGHRADMAALLSWQRSLLRAARHGTHPWQEPLLLEALVDEGRQALGG